MDQTTATSALMSPAGEGDLSCSACGYNLKGLPDNANCPECGQPVARTLRFGLAHSDPTWLRGQAAALPWLAALCINNILRSDFGYLRFSVAIYAGQLLVIAMSIAALIGCWRLSVPEENDASADDGSIRRGLRLAAMLLVLVDVASLPLFHNQPASRYQPPAGLFIYARPILLAATEFLALILLSHHANRSGSRSLRKHARAVLFVFPAVPLSALLPYAMAKIDLRAFAEYFLVVYTAFDFFCAVALIAMLLLLGRLYEVLRSAALSAEVSRA